MPRKWTRDKLLAALKEKAEGNDLAGWVEDEKDKQAGEEAEEIIARGLEAQLDYLMVRGVGLDEIADEFLDLESQGPYEDGTSRCQNCDWKGDTADTVEIVCLHSRVAPGEPMPSGQCPKCGALCQLEKAYVKVEYDRNYFGGDYSSVGEFVLIPVDEIQKTPNGVERAFEKRTNLNRLHIIHYSEDELYDSDGNSLD
jgi:hypothetical protein